MKPCRHHLLLIARLERKHKDLAAETRKIFFGFPIPTTRRMVIGSSGLDTKVLSVKRFPKYELRREIVSNGSGNPPIEWEMAYAHDGSYIGDKETVKFLVEKMGITPERANSHHNTASIGFSDKDDKWYGWSHRAIVGFQIGDKLFEENFGNDQTPFIEHGRKTINTLDEAKLAAIRFARSVS